ncbi:MAG: hypothetical protein KKH94_02375 [Candidatus Omnitrophica bacterium]|nr:hypothetical protein [Candidatus Omnitrophota bacterium]
MILNHILLIFFSAGSIVLFTWLLIIGKIKEWAFVILFIVVLLFSVGINSVDRLRELDLKNLRIVLNEMKEVKREVFAKEATVKAMGEEIAYLTAYLMTTVGRVVDSKGLTEKLYETREKLISMMHEIGSDNKAINKVQNVIDDTILHDLKVEAFRNIRETINSYAEEQQRITGNQIDNLQMHKDVQEMLFNEAYDCEGLIKYLKDNNVYDRSVDPFLDKIDNFSS